MRKCMILLLSRGSSKLHSGTRHLRSPIKVREIKKWRHLYRIKRPIKRVNKVRSNDFVSINCTDYDLDPYGVRQYLKY